VELDDGIELFVLEGKAGIRLHSYRRGINAPPVLKVGLWPTKPSPALREKRLSTISDLIAEVRLELGTSQALQDKGIAL
jgi:hypothetical protein